MATVEFPFGIEDPVLIRANGLVGTVVGTFVDRASAKWILVQYTDTAKMIHEQYFRETELSQAGAAA